MHMINDKTELNHSFVKTSASKYQYYYVNIKLSISALRHKILSTKMPITLFSAFEYNDLELFLETLEEGNEARRSVSSVHIPFSNLILHSLEQNSIF